MQEEVEAREKEELRLAEMEGDDNEAFEADPPAYNGMSEKKGGYTPYQGDLSETNNSKGIEAGVIDAYKDPRSTSAVYPETDTKL